MTDPIALIRAALDACANVDWSHGKDVEDGAPDFLSDWQRGLVAGQKTYRAAITAIDPAAILRRVQEGQHGQG